MVKNIKFHAIAISIIVLVIIVLYITIGPKTVPQVDADAPLKPTDHYVRMVTATWGQNCTMYIDEAIRLQATTPLPKDDKGNAIPQKPVVPVTLNNVLPNVQKLCDGKLTCEIPTNSDVLGVEPLMACYKKLNVSYRCAEMALLVIKEVDQGQSIQIDCTPSAQNAPAPATNP